MLNNEIRTALNDALDTKDLYKRVLDALIAAIVTADWAGLVAPSARDCHGRTLCWLQNRTARCPDCGGELWILVPDADWVTTTLEFCPQTWDLRVLGADGRMVAAATRRTEAVRRSLPPGSQVTSKEIGGVKVPFDPPWVVGGKDDGERK